MGCKDEKKLITPQGGGEGLEARAVPRWSGFLVLAQSVGVGKGQKEPEVWRGWGWDSGDRNSPGRRWIVTELT